jgi:hypothetical protein
MEVKNFISHFIHEKDTYQKILNIMTDFLKNIENYKMTL